MNEEFDFGNKTPRGIDLDRLRYARSLAPEERIERSRRAAESVILLREAGRKMREAKGDGELDVVQRPNDLRLKGNL